MSVVTSRAFVVGAIVIIVGAGVLTLLGAVLAIPLAALVGYGVAAALDPPRPFIMGLLLGVITAIFTTLAWFVDTPTFSLMGEPPDQMGWQILAIAMLVSVGLGGVVTKSFAVLFGPART
ncbi:MAG: hypothetical protein PVG27_11250 [Chloroflexota bacterium]|jgi:hypothetical protein